MRYVFLLPFLLTPFLSFSQNAPGKISGQVLDRQTKIPVDFATISIYKRGGASPFNGISADHEGKFNLQNIPLGEYTLTIDFLGYQRKSQDISLNTAKPELYSGKIFINPVQTKLAEVTVTSSVATVQNRIDKLVYNPANDLTSQGGLALDVLRKVPQVTVDIDGNVELQGNTNIRFLINGKPSSIFGSSINDALQSIPASQIKNIEVITVPGAKYDAQGTGGIINIVLKDNKVEGINGSVNLSAGTRLENGSFNLNAKKGKLGANLFFSGNEQLNSTTLLSTNRSSYNAVRDTFTNLYQNGRNSVIRGGYEGGLNLTYSISPRDEVTASLGLNHFENHNTGFSDQLQTVSGQSSILNSVTSLRNSGSSFKNLSKEVSIAYKKTFKREDEELDFLYSSSYGNNRSTYFQQQNYPASGLETGSRSNNPGTDHETNISLDYTDPVTKHFTLETGAKLTIEKIGGTVLTDTLSSSRTYLANAGQSYGFNYNRKVLAAYLSATFSVFDKFLDIKSGLRYEYTLTNANFSGVHIPAFSIYAPTLVFSHKFNEKDLVKASYTYRIERPDYGDLNPFYNISDPHNISTGNPNLRPEIGHNYELGFNSTFEKGSSIYIAAIYRHNTQDIQSFTTFYPSITINGVKYTNVSLNQRYNIGSEVSTGVNLYGSLQVTPKLNLRSNMFFIDRITSNPGSPQVSGFAYRINLNGSYKFEHDLAAEFFLNYRSSQRTIQGRNAAFANYNLAIRKLFLNKKASIGLTASNPFNHYVNQQPITSGPDFYQTTLRQVPFRSFGISLSYKFGKLEFKGSKEHDDSNAPAPAEN